MLKQAPNCVLTSKTGNTEGFSPFAGNHYKGDRFTRSVVCTSSALDSPCGLAWEWRVPARQGWEGDIGWPV